jgi:hypothetical protein
VFNKLYTVILILFLAPVINAQEPNLNGGMENGTTFNVIYKHDASGKIYANTRGLGFSFRRSKHVTAQTRSFYEIDGQNLRHPKEVKLTGDASDKKRFVYGKISNVLLLRGGIGLQNVLYGKADNKAVEVRYSYSFGPVFAFAKPYYVNVYKNRGAGGSTQSTFIKFDTENFYKDSGVVVGRAPFSKGLDEIKIYPGLSGKLNLSFEYAPYTNLIRAVETGICLDYFPKALPLMARNPSENLVLTIYVGFVFGSKWY